ncbi:hypothetical protein BaRGS_00003904, partial [Batillaria attramentaria]
TEGQGTKAVNRLILLTLRRRGKAAYAGLHKALRQADQDDVCETLLDTELALRDGLAADRAALAKLHNKDQQYMVARDTRIPTASSASAYSDGWGEKRSKADRLHVTVTMREGMTFLRHMSCDARSVCDSFDVQIGFRENDPDFDVFLRSSVLTKPTSPAFRSPGTSRQPSRTSSHRNKSVPSPSISQTPRTQGEDKEETIKRLEEQINDLRQSHTQMESELRQQIDKLEKEQKAKAGEKGKNGGGCSVM